ncbi:MAG TPA: peptidoglycan-binding protein [Caulobacteraceae bacterium]|nr:peptidoglycan-binding protein [Caulobacteraceae bacterium]
MAANAPWSVKGIDPKAREIAKDLARRSGMTLGEWLNQMILEDNAAADEPPAPRSADPSPYNRFEAPDHPGDDVLRATAALDRLSARIEAAENRATLAISGIDQSVSGILSRLDQSEREQTAVAARFEGAVADIAGEQSRLGERVRQIELEAPGPRAVEAVRSMETALAKVASHLYDGDAKAEQRFAALRSELDEVRSRLGGAGLDAGAGGEIAHQFAERLGEAEARTSDAMRDLKASLAQLDERIGATEARAEGNAPEARLEQLAVSLSARVDAARAEMAAKIREAADGRFERIERSLVEMTTHVQTAERRSAHAIERMGHEVLRMADTLGRRVQDVEHRSADAIEQVGGEVARMANAMDARLARTDEINAQALEKLGGEIARITERLAERISNAERRSAQAMDDMGEQVARVSDRLQDRHERASIELVERIRLSEERTARLLEDARERIDQRLEQTQRKLTEAVAPEREETALFQDPDVAPFGRERYEAAPSPALPEDAEFEEVSLETAEDRQALIAESDAEIFAEAEEAEPPTLAAAEPIAPETRTFAAFDDDDDFMAPIPLDDDVDDILGDAPAHEVHTGEEAVAQADDHADDDASLDEDLLAAEAMARGGETIEGHDEPALAQAEPEPPRAPLSARELIEQTRAASRAAPSPAELRRQRPNSRRAFGARGKGPSAMTTALFVSGGAAALSMALVGYEFVLQKPAGQLPTRVAEVLGIGAPATPLASERPAAGEGGQPLAAVALNPTPANPIAGPSPNAQQTEAAAEFYADGVRRIEAHDNSGLAPLKRAANLGYAPAEFYLAKLYEGGQAGLKKDLGQARTWTERAAEGGDVKAMHNLALDYFEGTGGPKDLSQAADWFHRAADQGLVDSEYNLARLYEEGLGVARNPAEAYKWYLIAARSGDAESRTAAQRLKNGLSPEAQSAAERSAQGFAPQLAAANSAPAASSSTGDVVQAQRGLSRLGYYQGPYDGVNSPALSLAIAAFQRDQGLPATGALDPTVNQRLAAAAQ